MSTRPTMRDRRRTLAVWSLRLLLALLLLVAVYLTTLFYPQPLFDYQGRYDGYRVWSDEPPAVDLAKVIEETAHRVEAMEHPTERAAPRIFLCGPGRYALFARLTRKHPDTLAIGLSVANEVFVSTHRVRLFATTNRGRLRHTRFEGNLAEVIAHEIAHFHSARALGYRQHLAQPVWKSEGWAEYQANLWAIRRDPAYDLGERIDWLLGEGHWSGGSGDARDLWEWQLLVEFLGEIRGYRLRDLVRTEVTRPDVLEQMLRWHRQHQDERCLSGSGNVR